MPGRGRKPAESQPVRPIKRTVAIHPLMDDYIRKTWAIMIEGGVPDPSYSAALNMMLVASVFEAAKKRGWSREAGEMAWGFAFDNQALQDLKEQEALATFRETLMRQEMKRG